MTSTACEFGPFRLDAVKRLLWREGVAVPLPSKALEILVLLVENRDRVLEKSELMSTVWPDSFVEESNLTQSVFVLRKALGETPSDHRFIVTVPGRGYRFVASVTDVGSREEDETRAALAREPVLTPTLEGGRPRRPRAWLVAGALVLAGGAGAALLVSRTGRSAPPRTILEVKSIAVLPFKSLGEGSEELLGVGMADTLITRLSTIRQITVRPTRAVMKYSAPDQDLMRVGRELGVEALLDGTIQRSGDRVRVTVQLLRVSDGAPIWAAKFDEAYSTVFRIQDRISEGVARELTPGLSREEMDRLNRRYTESAEAYDEYSRGRFFWDKRTEESLQKAIRHFEQALRIDPGYALAYVGLAECYAIYNVYGALHMKEALPKARVAAEKALELDDGLAEAHTTLALVKEQYEYDWAGAEKEFKRALEIRPNYATAHHWYSEFLAFQGRTEESLVHIGRARELEPTSLMIATQQGFPYFCARRYALAMQEYRKGLELDPHFPPALYFMGQSYVDQSMFEEGIAEYRKAIAISGASSALKGRLGYAYARSGRRAEAVKTLRDMEGAGNASPFDIAIVHAGLGDRQRALVWLEKAYAERDDRMVLLGVDAHLDGVRSEARFAELLRRVGLARPSGS